jgi:EmrB/QacA subfamily drug resistance transporter
MLLLSGTLADRLGTRTVYVGGMVIFTLASAACAVAQTPLQLNLGRAVQGIGAAALFSASLALLGREFNGRARAIAFGAWGASLAGALAVGPLVGGALTDSAGWRSIYLVNLPVGVVTLLVAVLARVGTARRSAGRMDWWGTALLTAGLTAVVFGLIRGNEMGWASPRILALFGAAAVLGVAFVAVERRHPAPLFDLGLLRIRTLTGSALVALSVSGAMIGTFLYVTLYLQLGLGFEPLEVGLRLLPFTLAAFGIAPLVAHNAHRLPARGVLAVAMALVTTGLLLMGRVTPDSEWTALVPGLIIAGLGFGATGPVLTEAALGAVPVERTGAAAGLVNTFRQVGTAIGIAALGAVFQARVLDSLAASFAAAPALPPATADPLADRLAEHPVALGEVVAGAGELGPRIAADFRTAVVDGLSSSLTVAAVVAALGIVAALALVRATAPAPHAAAEPEPTTDPRPAGATPTVAATTGPTTADATATGRAPRHAAPEPADEMTPAGAGAPRD